MHFSNHNPWGWEGQLGRAQRTYNLHGGQFNTMLTTPPPPPCYMSVHLFYVGIKMSTALSENEFKMQGDIGCTLGLADLSLCSQGLVNERFDS